MKLSATLPALLVLALSVVPAQAQSPDTTDAARYLPLHLGDVWEYERWRDECAPEPPFCDPVPDGFLRREVVRDTVFDAEQAWIVRDSRFSTEGAPLHHVDLIVRYDSTATRAFANRLDGDPWGPWPDGFPCRLDAPVEGDADCEGPGYAEVDTWTVFDEPVAVKRYVSLQGTHSFVADVGLISSSGGEFAEAGKDIVYACVDGVEYGTRFPVASESEPGAITSLGLAVHPNPLRFNGTLSLQLGAPERVRVEAFDVLGRRVALLHDGPLSSGEHRLGLDATALPAGIYVIRATGGGSAESARFTVLE